MRAVGAVWMLSVLAGFGLSCGSDGDRRLREIDALRERRDPASIERLERLCADPSPEIRAFSLSALAGATHEHAADRVVAAFEDDAIPVRTTAVRLAGELGLKSTTAALGRLLGSDRSVEIRRRAAASLGEIGGEDVLALLAPGLGDEDPGVREASARALAALPDPSAATAALERTLQLDPEPKVRLEAVRALKKVDSDAAREAIAAASSDPSEFVRQEAMAGRR